MLVMASASAISSEDLPTPPCANVVETNWRIRCLPYRNWRGGMGRRVDPDERRRFDDRRPGLPLVFLVVVAPWMAAIRWHVLVVSVGERLIEPVGCLGELDVLPLDDDIDGRAPPLADVTHIGKAEVLDAGRCEGEVFLEATPKIGRCDAVAAPSGTLSGRKEFRDPCGQVLQRALVQFVPLGVGLAVPLAAVGLWFRGVLATVLNYEELGGVVDEGLHVAGAHLRQLVASHAAWLAAVPGVWAAGLRMRAETDNLLAVAKDLNAMRRAVWS